MAIAQLYDLISQSSRGRAISVNSCLGEIAKTISASLLGKSSNIKIEVNSERLDIDPDRAVPFGLLVNELATNAIKHAFPNGVGSIHLRVEQVDRQIELTVTDDGIGIEGQNPKGLPEKRGFDYVTIFVRQLGGVILPSRPAPTGTTVRISLPLLMEGSTN